MGVGDVPGGRPEPPSCPRGPRPARRPWCCCGQHQRPETQRIPTFHTHRLHLLLRICCCCCCCCYLLPNTDYCCCFLLYAANTYSLSCSTNTHKDKTTVVLLLQKLIRLLQLHHRHHLLPTTYITIKHCAYVIILSIKHWTTSI